jgi:predicted GNAT superfamily acetyltransferase
MATLSDVGFQPVPHEPCCWIRKGVIVFFYVDDIVVAHRKGKEKEANEVVNAIKQKYSLQGGGELQ